MLGYYVAARHGGRTLLLVGPFDVQADAAAEVLPSSRAAREHDLWPLSGFWEWGVARVEADELPERRLDGALPGALGL